MVIVKLVTCSLYLISSSALLRVGTGFRALLLTHEPCSVRGRRISRAACCPTEDSRAYSGDAGSGLFRVCKVPRKRKRVWLAAGEQSGDGDSTRVIDNYTGTKDQMQLGDGRGSNSADTPPTIPPATAAAAAAATASSSSAAAAETAQEEVSSSRSGSSSSSAESSGTVVTLKDRGGVSKDRLAFEQLGTREVDRLFSTLEPCDVTGFRRKPTNLLGATALVGGTAVGAGILALPAATLQAGLLPSSVGLIMM